MVIIVRLVTTDCIDLRNVIELLLRKLDGQVHGSTAAVPDVVMKLQPILLAGLETADKLLELP